MNILRDYQREVLNKLKDKFADGAKELVVAIAPSGGKTEVAKHFIKETEGTFLVMPHGTNVIKNQWEKELRLSGIEVSDNLGEGKVCCNLPHSLHKKDLPMVDYLIVDEAHEFNFAEMMKTIKEKVKAKHIIYLTGTPSRFIKEKIEVICVPASKLIEEGYANDLYISLVTSNCVLDDSDYNSEGDVILKSDYKLTDSVTEDLDRMLEAMHSRLCETDLFKSNPKASKTFSWLPTLGTLHKTLIACKSIDQCNRVVSYFKSKGVSAVSSESDNDKESLNIQRFAEDPSIKVLVVVNRGILGFNMPDLVNVVDLTGTRNINKIYQLYARAMRKHPDHQKKFFFKISSESQMMVNKTIMNAALMLMFEPWLLEYNGENLKRLKIPVKKSQSESEGREALNKNVVSSGKRKSYDSIPVDYHFMKAVEAFDFLNNINNEIGNPFNEYAYESIKSVLEKACGKKCVMDVERYKILSEKYPKIMYKIVQISRDTGATWDEILDSIESEQGFSFS